MKKHNYEGMASACAGGGVARATCACASALASRVLACVRVFLESVSLARGVLRYFAVEITIIN